MLLMNLVLTSEKRRTQHRNKVNDAFEEVLMAFWEKVFHAQVNVGGKPEKEKTFVKIMTMSFRMNFHR